MRSVKDFVDSIFDMKESDQTDPLTLFNLIVRHDARHMGYNWGTPWKQVTPAEILQTPMPMQGPGGYVTEAKKKAEEGQQRDAQTPQNGGQENSAVPQQNMQQGQQVQTTTGEVIDVEFNKVNPAAFSSLPQVNNCPAFFMKDMQSAPICRVTNRVCIYMNSDYKNCGVYNTASSSDPNIWELPPGKEGTYAYIMGLKQ